MTNKLNQKSFCSICKNAYWTPKYGFLCGLTKEKQSFENNCEDFKLNESSLEEKLSPTIELLNKSENGGYHFLEKLSKEYRDLRSIKNKIQAGSESLSFPIIFPTIKRKKLKYLIIGICLTLTWTYFLIFKRTVSLNSIVLVFYSVMYAISGYLIFSYFYSTTIVTLLKEGVKYKKQFIRWVDILIMYREVVSDGRSSVEYLILQLHNKKEVKILVNDIDDSKLERFLLIQLSRFQNNYYGLILNKDSE